MRHFSREKIYGIVGTAVFHILLLLLLYLLVMEPVPPQPEKSNIEMQGAEDVAGEKFFEAKVIPDEVQQIQQSTPPPPAAPSKGVEEPLISQKDEQSMPVDTVKSVKKEKKSVQSEADRKRAEEERRKAAEEAERKAKEEAERKAKEKIAKSVAGSFGKSGQISSSGGENTGVGNAGDTEGGADKGLAKGSGGGHGIEASVGNRNVVSELNRSIPVQEAGTVVVHVIVNPQGQVISANAKTTSVALKRVAEKEAMKIRFNKVSELTENENGTITFRFKMNY